MLQNMGHEVRAPLGLFRGYTDLLAKESLGPLTDEQRDAIKVLGEKGEQLMSIVDRLLTLQTIDKDRLQKTTVDVAALIHQVAFEWRVVAEKKKMTIGVSVAPDLPVIQADRPLLIQVLGNLLDNAVKYSLERDEIRIGAGFDAGYVIIAVRDTGQGISPNALTQVFERFFREGDVRAEIKGVGIGLALCKAVVEAHDGRIWAESPGKGKGTTFFVALPA
jgi:signal transduction histidine kinase